MATDGKVVYDAFDAPYCYFCDGTGEGLKEDERCVFCGGKGRIFPKEQSA